MKTFKEFVELQEANKETKEWKVTQKGVLEWEAGKEYFWVKKDDQSFLGVYNDKSLEFSDATKVKEFIDKNFKIPVTVWQEFVKLAK